MTDSSQDAFPPTLNTWLAARLDDGTTARAAINRHVMEAYEAPLRIYYLGTSWRTFGEPDDIINGFLADRLDRPDFFAKWQTSDKRLRHWLINALHFYLKEQWRRERRHDASSFADESWGGGSDLDQEIDRAWARALVSAACRDAQQSCIEDDLETHWRLFIRHHLDDIPYRQCAEEFGVDPKRCAVMVRTASTRFRAALHDRMRQDGVGPEDLDDELLHLQEAIS